LKFVNPHKGTQLQKTPPAEIELALKRMKEVT
jgi:phage-related protein